jgi:uncharacterized protein involved in exopolysaccharide biosynthesis
LELRLKPEHPDILRTKRLIRDLEGRVAAESSVNVDVPPPPLTSDELTRRERVQQTRAEIESLQRQVTFKEAEEQRLRKTVADYQRRIEQVPGVESEWIALTRDYDTQQAAYKDLLTKSEASNVATELEKRQIGEQFRVLDPARPPARPTGMPRIQVNAIAAGIGLVLGLAIGALMELMNSSFRTSADVIEVLKLPVVALVPFVAIESDRRKVRLHRWLASTAAVLMTAVAGYGFWALQLWKHIK